MNVDKLVDQTINDLKTIDNETDLRFYLGLLFESVANTACQEYDYEMWSMMSENNIPPYEPQPEDYNTLEDLDDPEMRKYDS